MKKMEETKGICKTYLLTTSIKGIPKIMKADTRFLRSLWVISTVAGLALAGFTLFQLFLLFLSGAVVTGLSENSASLPFPDITVCNLNPFGNIRRSGNSFEQYIGRVEEMDIPNSLRHDLLRVEAFFDNFNITDTMAHQATRDFLLDCKWFEVDANYAQDCSLHVDTYHYTNRGLCYTLELRSNSTADDEEDSDIGEFIDEIEYGALYDVEGVIIIIYLDDFLDVLMPWFDPDLTHTYASGLEVLFHSPYTLPDLEEGIIIPPGHHVSIKMELYKRILLPDPYSDCQPGEYIDTELTMGLRVPYTKFACGEFCHQKAVMELCGCLDGYRLSIPVMRSRYPYCQNIDDLDKLLERMDCVQSMDNVPVSCVCPENCATMRHEISTYMAPWPQPAYQLAFYEKYIRPWDTRHRFHEYESLYLMANETNSGNITMALQALSLLKRNFIQMKVTFDSSVLVVHEDHPALNLESFLGSLGGALNLWAGIQYLTIIELFEFLYRLVMQRFQKKAVSDNELERNASNVQDPVSLQRMSSFENIDRKRSGKISESHT